MKESDLKKGQYSEEDIYEEDEDEFIWKNEDSNIDNPTQFPEGGTGGNPSKRVLNKVILHHLKNEENQSSSHEDSKINDQNDNIVIGSNSENSKQVESYWPSRVNDILKGFDPKELVPKQSLYDKVQMSLLKLKSLLPLIVTVGLIYFLGLMYIFTYCLPLVSDNYNDNTYFFYQDDDKIEGLRQLPGAIKVEIMIFALCLFIMINISLIRAIYTPAGGLPGDYEWDIKDEVLTIFKHKNQLTENPLDIDIDKSFLSKEDVIATKRGLKYLEKAASEKYFGMNMSAVEVGHKLFNPPGSTWVIVKGVEENLALRFHHKYKEINKSNSCDSPKSAKMEKTQILIKKDSKLDQISEHAKSEDNNETAILNNNEENIKRNYEKLNYDSQNIDEEITISKISRNRSTLFPIFSKIYETKPDGCARICIRCLKTKPDRCHHCSICNNCIRKMDHHCPWLNNWIGFNNYKYFFNTIFYCSLSSILASLTYWEVWGKQIDDEDSNIFIIYLWSINYFLTVIFGLVLTLFTIFHVRLMITNYTTLEFWEKKREKVIH